MTAQHLLPVLQSPDCKSSHVSRVIAGSTFWDSVCLYGFFQVIGVFKLAICQGTFVCLWTILVFLQPSVYYIYLYIIYIYFFGGGLVLYCAVVPAFMSCTVLNLVLHLCVPVAAFRFCLMWTFQQFVP